MRYRKTKTIGVSSKIKSLAGLFGKAKAKVPKSVKSHVEDSMNFTNKSPKVQGLSPDSYSHKDKSMVDLTEKKGVGTAESSLVLKGEKHMSAIVALSIKNNGELSDVAKEALHKAVDLAQKSKGLVDWKGDYVFIVFSPIVTRTYKNEVLAARVGMEILDSLNAYNKKFKDKIEFSIGAHAGDLVASKAGGKLKYTGIGNTISLAKRISDSGDGNLVVSDVVRKKMLRDLKVTKGEDVGGNPTYVVSGMKDKSGDQEKLKELLKRSG